MGGWSDSGCWHPGRAHRGRAPEPSLGHCPRRWLFECLRSRGLGAGQRGAREVGRHWGGGPEPLSVPTEPHGASCGGRKGEGPRGNTRKHTAPGHSQSWQVPLSPLPWGPGRRHWSLAPGELSSGAGRPQVECMGPPTPPKPAMNTCNGSLWGRTWRWWAR